MSSDSKPSYSIDVLATSLRNGCSRQSDGVALIPWVFMLRVGMNRVILKLDFDEWNKRFAGCATSRVYAGPKNSSHANGQLKPFYPRYARGQLRGDEERWIISERRLRGRRSIRRAWMVKIPS